MDRPSNVSRTSAFLRYVFYEHFETVCACKYFAYSRLHGSSNYTTVEAERPLYKLVLALAELKNWSC